MKRLAFIAGLFITGIGVHPTGVFAYQPVLERRTQVALETPPKDIYVSAQPVGDPTFSSLAIFGEIRTGREIDMYVFRAQKDETIPVEVLVPASGSYRNFRPTLYLIGKNLPPLTGEPIPIELPISFDATDIPSPVDKRTMAFDLGSLTAVYHGTRRDIPITANTPYYIAILDPYGRTGTYIIHIGSKTNYSESAQSSAPTIDPDTILFDESLARNTSYAAGSSEYEKKLFQTDKSPFQIWDSKVKLWLDILAFVFYRIQHIL